MLTLRHRKWLYVGLILLAVGIALLALPYASYCERPDSNYQYRCTPYEITTALLSFLEAHNALITAGATVAIAAFTIVLTNVSKRQTSLTRDALIHTDRAFVFLKTIEYLFLGDKDTKQLKSWRFIPQWQNTGNTPTVRMMSRMTYQLRTIELPRDFDFPDEGTDPPGRSLIGPKAAMHGQHFEISVEHLKNIATAGWRAYVWGWADYDDVFTDTERHRTEFCFQIIVGGDPSRTDCRFYFRMTGRFNGADSECCRRPSDYAPG